MMKKYELLKNDTVVVNNSLLYRIRALKNIGHVRCGELGGYIEKEDNLSHDGSCWVANKSCILEDARLDDNAITYSNSKISGKVVLSDKVRVGYNVIVHGHFNLNGRLNIRSNLTTLQSKVFIITNMNDISLIGPVKTNEFTGLDNYATVIHQQEETYVVCGCFEGRFEDFKIALKKPYKVRDDVQTDYVLKIQNSMKEMMVRYNEPKGKQ